MNDDRLLIPHDPDYFHAIGLATIAFARLEWNAVWCCERLQPGYIATIESKKKTAGIIGRDLNRLFGRIDDSPLRSKIGPLAREFESVVLDRNGLLHGKPITSPTGDQRLFRNGSEWTINAINSFSDRCVKAASPLNALLYGELAEPCMVTLR